MLPVFCFPEEWKKGNKQPSYVREFSESMPEIGILKLLCCWQQTGGQKRLGMWATRMVEAVIITKTEQIKSLILHVAIAAIVEDEGDERSTT